MKGDTRCLDYRTIEALGYGEAYRTTALDSPNPRRY